MPQPLALIVDDEPAIRSFLINLLRLDGCGGIEADNGKPALHLVRTLGGKVDLIVTDIRMPEMDGRTLATRVHTEYPAIPILLMSGYADEAGAAGRADLCFPFLTKPFTSAAFREVVAGLLKRHKRLAR